MNPQKIKNLIKIFTSDPTEPDFSEFDNEFQKLKDALKEKVQAKTLEDVNSQNDKFRQTISAQIEKLNYQPLVDAFEKLKGEISKNSEDNANTLTSLLDEKQKELNSLLRQSDSKIGLLESSLREQADTLKKEISVLSARKVEIPDFGKQITETEAKLMEVIQTAKEMDDLKGEKSAEELQKQFANFETTLKRLRAEIQSKGGGMNRNIAIGGNTSVLSRYTDINIKAGSNVTLTYSNNNTTKYLDLTIASSGGGSVGGTVRSIQTLTVSSTIGTLVGTDQVYLANGGLQVTLPTAVGDTNLYTIKNIGTSSVLINTVSAQTIDDDATVIMPVRYTSIDLISDNTNWKIT